KLQLKKKQGEYELLQARTAGGQEVGVLVEAQYEKAQLDKTIEALKVEESAAKLRIENFLEFEKKLRAEIRELVSGPSGSQVATIRSLTQENTSLKSLLKQKVAEYKLLQAEAQAARGDVEVEVPVENLRPTKKANVRW